ncbi:histone acetyltransferase type B catalytic subunit-like [Xenia sp. Carnegie-2017]|uniref:histone acetyltransferase type B catalytic subunit-like n=1 Tax=Xenia sp. Carnegie-2017 TaxID=2897299 RepID=UPI001F042ECC|nr:histone acetyltransferase type B catalytic subunit-like [Xenia sp. Carnegie-2017]XP_046846731.1 histone acetyltransferase type B catalytic subunit-like [Xenia sp. Carnegie-2017]
MAATLVSNILEEYKCDANSSVHIKLVENEKDVFNKEKAFHPNMSHQIFGDSEVIFGYKNLEVQLYYHAGSLLTYLGIKYSAAVDKLSPVDIKPDDVISLVKKVLAPGHFSNLDQFLSKFPEEDKFTPMGELIETFIVSEETYQVYKAGISTPRFKSYHERLQTFVLWYIDAASFLDMDDSKWDFFLMFKKSSEVGITRFSIAGYTAVYRYYAYPDMKRPRISQFLILPTFQKKGLGAKLLLAVDNHYTKDKKVLDMTVEDPVNDFLRLRDYVDVLRCRSLPVFKPNYLCKGFSKEMVDQARRKLKVNQHQCRRVYEILRLGATNLNDPEEHRKYRLEIKKRLNAPFQKEKADLKKLQRVLTADEYAAAVANISQREQLNILEENYRETIAEYKRILERVAAS